MELFKFDTNAENETIIIFSLPFSLPAGATGTLPEYNLHVQIRHVQKTQNGYIYTALVLS